MPKVKTIDYSYDTVRGELVEPHSDFGSLSAYGFVIILLSVSYIDCLHIKICYLFETMEAGDTSANSESYLVCRIAKYGDAKGALLM